MYSGEESCRDVLTLSAWLRWGFEPLCVLGDKALTLVWLRLGNNSRLWTSCWQFTTWWWPGYSIFVFLMCCVALLSIFSIKTSGSDLHLFLPLRVTLSIGTQLRLWESTCPIWQTLRALRNPFTLSALLHSLTHSFAPALSLKGILAAQLAHHSPSQWRVKK